MKIAITLIFLITLTAEAEAVSMSEAMNNCYADGRKWCPNLGHGSKMQDCLNQHFQQLSPGCQNIVIRLNQGEKITLF